MDEGLNPLLAGKRVSVPSLHLLSQSPSQSGLSKPVNVFVLATTPRLNPLLNRGSQNSILKNVFYINGLDEGLETIFLSMLLVFAGLRYFWFFFYKSYS